MKFAHFIIFVSSIFILSCASQKTERYNSKEYESPESLYIAAIETMNKKEFSKSAELFEDLEKEFPYSEWAVKGQIMHGYIQYLQGNYVGAISSMERFLQFHPLHENSDYAYYLIAMSYYDRINPAGRDQEITIKAMEALEEIIKRFPHSAYAKDAKVKLSLTINHLAASEMHVARFYLNKNNRIAALKRYSNIIENYSKTPYVVEALYRMAEIYYSMGLDEEAQAYAAILGHNFPNDPWYHKIYKILNK